MSGMKEQCQYCNRIATKRIPAMVGRVQTSVPVCNKHYKQYRK